MFRFDGAIDRGAFLRASALRLGLFIASVVGFPFLLMAIVAASGCRGAGGACGALGLVVGTAFKPLAFILFVFSFVGISVRRARDAGMPGLVGLFIPLLFTSNYAFLIYAGAPWSVGFSAGVLYLTFPWASVLALYCIMILCVLPSRPPRDANPFGAVGLIAFGLGSFIAVSAMLGFAISFAGVQPWALQLGRMMRYPGQIAPLAMIVFAAALAWIAWQHRSPPFEAARQPNPPRETVRLPAPPIMWLLAAALVPTLIACIFSFGDDVSMMIPLVLVMNLTSLVLPTLAIYFFLLLGLWLTVFRRTPISVAVLLLALLPFLHWGYSHRTARNDFQREAAEIAAVQTKAAPRIPTTMVFESERTDGLRGAWKVPSIDRVIAKGAYGPKLLQFGRNGTRSDAARPPVDVTLPDEYLLLKVGRSSSFAKNRQIYAANGGPFELRYVNSSRDDLVAVWYHAYNPGPSVLPVLTSAGWYRGSNSVRSGEIEVSVGKFLTTSLKLPS